MDEERTCRPGRAGLQVRIGTFGTIGWIAPELENDAVAPSYGREVDVWALDAVAYFVLVAVEFLVSATTCSCHREILRLQKALSEEVTQPPSDDDDRAAVVELGA